MSLKIQSHKAELRFPPLFVIMGAPKVGKSTMMAKLPKALILDLEGGGYRGLDVKSLAITTNLDSVKEGVELFLSPENTEYKFLVIDHLRMLTSFLDKRVAEKHEVQFTSDIGFGKGINELKLRIDRYLKGLQKELAQYKDRSIILVAHSTDKNNEIRLDVDGKNESLVLGLVDAVGFMERDEDNQVTINFQTHRGAEYGTRNPFLSNYKGEFTWQKLFDLSMGKTEEKPKTAK